MRWACRGRTATTSKRSANTATGPRRIDLSLGFTALRATLCPRVAGCQDHGRVHPDDASGHGGGARRRVEAPLDVSLGDAGHELVDGVLAGREGSRTVAPATRCRAARSPPRASPASWSCPRSPRRTSGSNPGFSNDSGANSHWHSMRRAVGRERLDAVGHDVVRVEAQQDVGEEAVVLDLAQQVTLQAAQEARRRCGRPSTSSRPPGSGPSSRPPTRPAGTGCRRCRAG